MSRAAKALRPSRPQRHLRRQVRRPVHDQSASTRQLAMLHATVIDQMAHGVCMFDAADRLLVANQRYRDIWQLPEALCQPGASFHDIIAASHGARNIADASAPPAAPGQPARRRREWQLDDGRIIEVVVTRLPDGACVALHEDITERRRSEQQVVYLSRHDLLTGLPNRAQLQEAMTTQLPRTGRGESLAVLCLDLDRFKAVNDTLGHAAGDGLLRQVAERLRQHTRDTDTVARLGGDEFAVLQVGTMQPAGATLLAGRLIAALAEPFDLDGHQAHIGTSVGVAIAPFDGDTPEVLLKCADLALYSAKAAGRGVLRYFEPEMDERMRLRRQLECDLRGAIERGEFELAYQAQVSAVDQAVTGVEALVRWRHPQRGCVAPADFIPLAEETGLIHPIGRWVLQQACRTAVAWTAIPVAVKVSPARFKSHTLLRDVLDALSASGLPPQRLELEITEAVLIDDAERALSTLHALRERGIRVALDDFGIGCSSLCDLRRFPFDKLKIDRSFVADVAQGGDALAIATAISALGRSLGMVTTAAGVQTVGQLHAVQQAGCAEVQGDLFGRPGPAAAITALIAAGFTPADHCTEAP